MQLAYVYNEYGEFLERDFFYYYHVDINECSIRRIRVLYDGLPYDALVNQEISEMPVEARLWTVDTYMMANLVDAISAVYWAVIAVNSKRKPPQPKPMTRPELRKRKQEPTVKRKWAGKTIFAPGPGANS